MQKAKELEQFGSRLEHIDSRIEQKLLEHRRIFISEGIDSSTTLEAIRKLWYLDLLEPGRPILLVINSPGGSIDAGFAIMDQIQLISSPVSTLITGLAASMGSIISLAAAPGKRFVTPNSRIMIHQPSIQGVIQGQASDLDIQAREILKMRDKIIEIYAQATKKKKEEIELAIDRDTWMSAEEAIQFGLVDKIVTSFKDLEK